MVYKKEINVASEVDDLVPFLPEALGAYLSFVGVWISAVNFLSKEFGKKATIETGKFVKDLAALYPESAKIFKAAQTSFARKGKGGLKLSMLRRIDSEKNASPSLHVQFAAFTYSRVSDVIEVLAEKPEAYEPIKIVYFEKAVEIIEATMLVRQHVILDVALGLAVLTGFEKGFTTERAELIVNALFSERKHNMPTKTIQQVRKKIWFVYQDVSNRIKLSNQPVHLTVIDYLKEYDAKT
jgi:hypothetical protein